jgi:hypothetical protein
MASDGYRLPRITINFRVRKDKFDADNIDSNIDVHYANNSNASSNKIAQISGDWHYSWLHAELFTIFEDLRYLVWRLTFYWIHKNYDKSDLEVVQESFDIESPDIKRFDFLIETGTKAKIN